MTTRYLIVPLKGKPTKRGGTLLRFEVVDRQGDEEDGGPVGVALTWSFPAAQRIVAALVLADQMSA